jgi:adenylate cyclase, class 2
MAHGPNETEIKLRVDDLREARRRLSAAGFRIWKRRVFESNVVLDTDARTMRADGCLLRLRRAGRIKTLTYKGPPRTGKHKSREERELQIPDADTLLRIFESVGLKPVFRYDKYRTEFMRPNSAGVATLDETPIGLFMELEGTPAWIDRTAKRLGYSEAAYITASYGRLYLEWCEARGVQPADMLFNAATIPLHPPRARRPI